VLRADNLTTFMCRLSWNMGLLEQSGPVQDCNGVALPITTSLLVSHMVYIHTYPMILYCIIITYTRNHSLCSEPNFKILPKMPAPYERFSVCRILLSNIIKHGTKTSWAVLPYWGPFTQSMPCPCRSHAAPMPCR